MRRCSMTFKVRTRNDVPANENVAFTLWMRQGIQIIPSKSSSPIKWTITMYQSFDHAYLVPVTGSKGIKATVRPGNGAMIGSALAHSASPNTYIASRPSSKKKVTYSVGHLSRPGDGYVFLWIHPDDSIRSTFRYEVDIVEVADAEWSFILIGLVCAICLGIIMLFLAKSFFACFNGIMETFQQRQRRQMLENADAAMNRALEANKKEVSEITTAIYSECKHIIKEDALCVICLDEYEPDSELRILRCGHHYHKECVDQWLIEKGNCCLCHQGLASGVNMYRPDSNDGHVAVSVGAEPSSTGSRPESEVQLASVSGGAMRRPIDAHSANSNIPVPAPAPPTGSMYRSDEAVSAPAQL